MGRGRAKAKQTKVARELKYRSVSTDFASLEAELRGSPSAGGIPSNYADVVDAYDDEDPDEDEDALEDGDDEAGEGVKDAD